MRNHYTRVRRSQSSQSLASLLFRLCLVLSFCCVWRARLISVSGARLHSARLIPHSFVHFLVTMLYILSIFFNLSASIVESGLGLSTQDICHAAIVLCVTFYFSSKMVMYLFLAERAHAIRAPYMRRSQDWIWLLLLFLVFVGLGTLTICAYLWPVSHINPEDGICRMGLPVRVSIPMLAYDAFVNIVFTGLFIWLMGPLIKLNALPTKVQRQECPRQRVRQLSEGPTGASAGPPPHLAPRGRQILHWTTCLTRVISLAFGSTKPLGPSIYAGSYLSRPASGETRIDRLIARSLVGAVLVLIPTAANLVIMFALRGKELGWLCLLICTVDGKLQSHFIAKKRR